MTDFIKGVDVSSENETINWGEIKNTQAQFAYIRVLDGMKTETNFKENWQGAASAALWRGAIHKLNKEEDAHIQAIKYVETMNDYKAELPPAIDITGNPNLDQINRWVDDIAKGFGKKPIIYTSAGLWNGIQDISGVIRFLVPKLDLWVANWQFDGKPEEPSLPRDWSNWHFWQYGKGWSYFNGTIEALREYAGIKAKIKTATIICTFLRGRAQPRYEVGRSEVIFAKGQELIMTDENPVFEASSGITWIQVEIPTCPCCSMWISNHPTFVKIEERLNN